MKEEKSTKELKFMGPYLRRSGLFYLLGILALFMVDLVNSLVPHCTGAIVDGLTAAELDMSGVLHIVLRLVCYGLIIAGGRFLWRFFLFGSARKIENDLRADLFAHLEQLSARYYSEHKTGDLMAHFTNDLAAVREFLGPTVVTAFDASVMLILVLYQMVRYVNLKLTLLAVVPLVLIIYGDYLFGRQMHKRYLEKQNAFSTLTDQVQETVSGIRVIKAFVQERKELYAFAKVNGMTKEKNLGVARLLALFIPLLDLVIGFSSLLTLIYGGWLTIHGTITVGRFVAFNSYINMLVWPMIAVGECITSLTQGLASISRILKIFQAEPDIVDAPDVLPVEELRGGIVLKGLSFTYPDEKGTEALRDISVEVKPGETMAILGRTGSGKSTLADLLLRLYDTEPGMITLDGHPIEKLPLAVLRRDIAYVPQDSFLFSDTIESNITFGSTEITHDAVEAAAKAADIHGSIMEFPEGYSTVIGERGVTLSGGQKQRISIARALMKDAPVLILDDALSAVDTDTEDRILRSLRENRKGKTTLIIAHRVSTIQHADHILVLEDGRAAEFGTHEELYSLGGIYRDMYDRQQLERRLEEKGGDAE